MLKFTSRKFLLWKVLDVHRRARRLNKGAQFTRKRGAAIPLLRVVRTLWKMRPGVDSPKRVFARIYRNNHWGNSETVSGPGSTLSYTENLRKCLPKLIEENSIRSIYDAPCGDFLWMSKVVEETRVSYIGADVVPALISVNKKHHPHTRFIVADITNDPFPAADLWLCRDCLFHLSNVHIYQAFQNFVQSNVPLILTSTHMGHFENTDISNGNFRLLNLFGPPFCLPVAVGARINDWIDPFPPREMCLWTREQIATVLPRMALAI